LNLALEFFLPFVIYGVLGISFIWTNLYRRTDPLDGPSDGLVLTLGVITAILSIPQIRVEIISFTSNKKAKKAWAYFNIWNVNDIIMLTLTDLLVVESFINDEKYMIHLWWKVMLSALATFCMTLKLFDWFRLFQETAFFIELIG